MNEKDNLQNFIDFIIELAHDEFDYCIGAIAIGKISMRYYFRHGGCLELAKVLQYFIPSARICYNVAEEHFVIKHNGVYYDAEAKFTENQGFQEISAEYIHNFEEKYGKDILFEGKPVHLALIQELKNCSGTYINNLIDAINNSNEENISRTLVVKTAENN